MRLLYAVRSFGRLFGHVFLELCRTMYLGETRKQTINKTNVLLCK